MNIPEELLKLSEKELKKKLSDNIYKTMYFVYGNNKSITKFVRRDKLYRYREDCSRVDNCDIKNYYKPLSIEKFNEIKRENIYSSVEEWDLEVFCNWVEKQFNSIYGKEFVDRDGQYIIVHFPEITIRNSAEQSHIMRDVYLKFYITNYKGIELIGLIRGTLTDVEVLNNYSFSHVNNYGKKTGDWKTEFCFGSTEIAGLQIMIKISRTNVIKNLSFFLEAIKEYLSWESIEGTPYNSIDNLIYNRKEYSEAYYPNYSSDQLEELVISNLKEFTYEYDYNTQGYIIKLSSSFRDEISDIIGRNYPEYLFYELDGKSVNKRTIDSSLEEGFPDLLTFKGESVPFKLIKTPPSEFTPPKKVHRVILNTVVERIEKKFNTYLKERKLNEYKV